MSSAVQVVHAREVFDSRGRPTVEASVELSAGIVGVAIVPSGASTGQHEAHELRDGDAARYGGLGVTRAVANVINVLAPGIRGIDADDQAKLDARMRELDGTQNLSRLGANAVLAVSMAACRAAASARGMPLWQRLASLARVHAPVLPLPMVNILSGGAHARGGMDIQDILAMPVGAASLDEALQMVAAVRTAARGLLGEEGRSVLLADEGGFSPGYASVEAGLELLVRAIERAHLRPADQVAIGLDIAATQLVRPDGTYELHRAQRVLSSSEMAEFVLGLAARYPIVSIEDPLGEDDWDAWRGLTPRARWQLIGDDLFCTNVRRIQRGVESGVANAVLIKVNQIGTVSDALAALRVAQEAGYRTVVSARSGETEDAFIADLAVGSGAGQIKVGSLATSERMAKYNQLVRIAEHRPALPFSSVGRELAALR
ncbi:MAG: phosphopyruvate hydratase [Chloroflexi bacterium]|nr:phosphopyruvate hydratase [Chloroflexota bacterium]